MRADTNPQRRRAAAPRRIARLLAASALAALPWHGASALDFTTGQGWQINLDTTLAAGIAVRTSNRNQGYIGAANGGLAQLPNGDDGDLNIAPGGVASAPLRATEEVSLKGEGFGAFLRATAFWDPVYDGTWPRDFKPVNRATARALGADARLMDAFVYADMKLFGHNATLRLGNQVINWGESSYLQGGINSAAAFDANALEAPGAELRDAVLAAPAADLRLSLSDALSLEAYYQLAWRRTHFEPAGSFFSTTDVLSDGAQYVVIDPLAADDVASLGTLNLRSNNIVGALIARQPDRKPSDQGQFGMALRYLAPFLNDAELALYFETFHNKIPMLSLRSGSQLAADNALSTVLTGRPGPVYNNTASYFADYPDQVHLLGASFSTTIAGGVGLQGEVSHRFDQPVLLNSAALIGVAEQPFLGAFAAELRANRLDALAALVQASYDASRHSAVGQALGPVGFDQYLPGYTRLGVSQAQLTATDLLGGVDSLGISSTTLVGEIGMNMIYDFPSNGALLAGLTGALGSYRNKLLSASTPPGSANPSQFASGMAVSASFEMPGLLPRDIDMRPQISFSTGLSGRNALGAGYFSKGQAALAVGSDFIWLTNVKLAISYVNHFGIGPTSGYILQDRDYISANLSYAF